MSSTPARVALAFVVLAAACGMEPDARPPVEARARPRPAPSRMSTAATEPVPAVTRVEPEEPPTPRAEAPERPRLACLHLHVEGWLLDCTEYVPGGAFLRDGRSVAERACSMGYGTLSESGCPRARQLGRCRDRDFVLHYYSNPHEHPPRDELRASCESNGGTFEDPERALPRR